MSSKRGPLAPQNERFCAESAGGLFACFSAPLSRFVRFNGSTNAVECSPPVKRSIWRVGGGGKATGGRTSDCGFNVDWRRKAWGKALENLCVKLSYTWTTYLSSTPSSASRPPQKTPVHNAAVLHKRPTAMKLSSSGRKSTQGSCSQRFVAASTAVIHGQGAALLL